MAPRLTPRDLALLAAVGRFRSLTRQQLKRWFFADVTEPVVTRVLDRLVVQHWLGSERIQGNGRQIVWLTSRGADLLHERGAARKNLFPTTGPPAAKDFAHSVAIGDAAAWLARRRPPPDEILPAWHLQRLFGNWRAIPDLLAIWRGGASLAGAALAVEVDLGTEPLKSVFLPKLGELPDALATRLPREQTHILILVPSARRLERVREALAGTPNVMIDLLELVTKYEVEP